MVLVLCGPVFAQDATESTAPAQEEETVAAPANAVSIQPIARDDQIARLDAMLLAWATGHHTRITRSDAQMEEATDNEAAVGVLIGYWDETDLKTKGQTL